MSSSNRFSKKFDGSVPKAALKARERQLAARASSSASSAPKTSSESSFAANSNNANASSSLAAATSSSSIPATGENAALNSASTARPPLSTASESRSAAPPAGNSKSNAASSSSMRTSRANISGSTRTINHDGRKINLPSLSGDVGSHRMRQQQQRHLNSQQLQQRQQQLHHQQSHQPSRRHIQNSSLPHSQNSHLKISQPEKSSSHESNEDKRRRGGFSYPPPEIIEGATSNASKNSSAVTSNDLHELLDAEHRSHAAETNAANSIMKGNRSVQISEDEIHTHLPQSPDQKESRQKRQQTIQNHHPSPISPQRHRNGLHDQHHPQEESLPSPLPTPSNSNAQTSNRDTIRLMTSQITPQIPSHHNTEESGDKFMSESLREAFNEAEEVIAQTMKDIPSSPPRAGQMGTEGAADDGHDIDDHDQNLVDTSEDLEFFDAPSFSEVQDAMGKSKDLLHEMSTRNDEIEKKDHVQNGDNHDGISGSSKTVKRSLVNDGNETIDSGANFTINSSAAAYATRTSIPNGSNDTPNIPTYHGAVDLAPTSLPPRPSRSVPISNAVQPRSNDETTTAAQPEQYNRVSYGKPTAPTSNPILSTPARRPGTEKTHSMASYTPDFRERTKGDYHSNVIYSTPTSTAFAPSGKPPLQDDDDNDNGGDGNDPKTPLTTMRNLMSSISKDRSEIEGARRPLFVSDDVMEGKKNDRPMDVSKNKQVHHNAENKGEDREFSEEDDDDWDEKELVDDEVNNTFFERREINSSCLRYGSGVVFRFRFTKALTSISLPPQGETNATKECIIINEAFGQFGGGNNGENRFVISKDTTSTTSTDPASQFVCYGDVVVLRSDFSGRLLGVKKIDAETTTDERERPFSLEVGCYRNLGRFPQADRWTILRGGANAPFVQLGSDQQPAVDEQRIPVYYGDSIILRNYWTGGILSIGDTLALDASSRFSGWSLNIITSSYQMNNGTASTEDDIPIIEYMQRCNQCRPTRKETFQIVSPDAPLCPDWVHPTGDGLDRIYLNGTYLLQRDRHQLMSEMELNLFSEVRTRSLSYDDDLCQVEHNQQLGLQPIDTQERILLDEIIGAMMGLEGDYFQLQSENENDPPHFSFVGDEIDSSLSSLVSRILPLCTNFVYVNRYVESTLCYYECGVIARILCESIGYILQEYLAFVSNLNYSLNEQHTDGMKVSMSMIHVQIKPSIRTMSILARIVNTVQGKKGGALLVSLQNLMTKHYNGDEKGNEIILQLLNKCAAPYARMMRSWMNGGRLHDPYKEFMIEITSRAFRDSHVTIKQGMEWIDWCKVQDENVLKSISISSIDAPKKRTIFGVERHRSTSSMSAVDKVHTTGKYWRTIHACNESAPFSFHSDGNEECDDVRDLLNPLSLSRFIDHAYQKASDTLLDLLLNKYDVLSSLIFMKKYFLLDQGDFFVDFLDAAEEELVQELPNVSQGRVQSWLASSVAKTLEAAPPGTTSQENSSASHSSQLASSLRFNFKKKSLNEQLEDFHRRGNGSKKRSNQRNLSGFEALELDFESVPFPTSLVLNVQQIRSYQFVFRQIFFAKYVERQLVHMWTDHQLLKQMMVTIRREFGPTLSLRRRMIHFIQNFVYYMKFDVIEPNWRAMESKLRAAKNYCSNNDANNTSRESFPRTVDDMLMEHNQFLICVVTQCLLTNSDLIKTVTKLMTTCLLFTTEIKKFIASTKLHEYHEITRVERSKLRHGKGSKNISGAEFRAKRDERIKRCSERILGELKTPTYQHMIRRFDEVFSTHLATFMKLLKEDHGSRSNAHLTNLMMQLDYNYFVSSSISTKE